MSDFKRCAEHMKKSLNKLKKISYEEIKNISKTELQQFIDPKCIYCSTIRRKIYAKGWVKLVMEVEDEGPSEKMVWPDELNLPEIYVESAASVDGFDIYSDGRIIEMHPEGCDDC